MVTIISFCKISSKKIENNLDRVETGEKFKEKIDINKDCVCICACIEYSKSLQYIVGEMKENGSIMQE